MHQLTEAINHFSSKTWNPHGTPPNILWNPRFRGTPVDEH